MNYLQLQDLYERYCQGGFVVFGFPCNQFGHQEPGKDHEIKHFVTSTFGVTFPMFSKTKVNGPEAHPVYKFLRSNLTGLLGNTIKWNYTKFLVNRQGVPVKRFAPSTMPSSIECHITKLLEDPK